MSFANNARFFFRLITDKQRRNELFSSFNDDFYWDDYARSWKMQEISQETDHLGDEWGGSENFLRLVRKYSKPDMVALEIGCGGGRITSKVSDHFKNLCASDISKEMLEMCKKGVSSENVSYQKLDGFTLKEFPDASMDFIFSHDVFVHFSSLQVYPYLAEIERVLKNDGLAVISFYGFSKSFNTFKKESLGYWSRRSLPPGMRIHFITEEMITLMAKDLDLDVVEIDPTKFLIAILQKK